MARNSIVIDRSVEQVFEALMRPANYGDWVVGAQRIRGTSGNWPSVGAVLHHAVGVGPLTLKDTTEIRELDPPSHLVLDARAWPLGRARVEITLVGRPDGSTEVVMVEEVVAGPANLIPDAINDRLVHVRNWESLRRFARVTRRT